MNDLISLAQKLSGVGFGVMLFIVLAGSYFRKWSWTRDLDEERATHKQEMIELRADYENRLNELRADYTQRLNKWESIAIRASGLAEGMVAIVKPRDRA
jgi:hypothetical protein